MLNEEKETVKIKNKIIESQNATISELKLQINEKNEEIKRADVELKRLLRDFNASNEESERIRIELCEEKKAKELMYEDIEVNQKSYYCFNPFCFIKNCFLNRD